MALAQKIAVQKRLPWLSDRLKHCLCFSPGSTPERRLVTVYCEKIRHIYYVTTVKYIQDKPGRQGFKVSSRTEITIDAPASFSYIRFNIMTTNRFDDPFPCGIGRHPIFGAGKPFPLHMSTTRKDYPPTIHRRWLIWTRLVAGLICSVMLVFPLPLVAGQLAGIEITAPPLTPISPAAGSTTTISDVLPLLKGQPASDSLYLGMWSWHFINDDDRYRSRHHLIGLSLQGVFLGTFLNSHSNRTWAGGWQRVVCTQRYDNLSLQTGYRIGLMHGYDELSLGGSKVFPLLQVYSDIRYRDIGVQLSWAGSVFLAAFLIRL